MLKKILLFKVKAAGVCGSDIPHVYKTGTYHYPLIPGHEFSGIVAEIGENVSTSWLGKRGGVFPLIPCKRCAPCKERKYELCEDHNYLGSRTNVGFAEYVKGPVWNLLELPDDVSFEQAAMLEPMAVAVHAIRQSKVTLGNTVAVCGLGTIGLFVVMFLHEVGCREIYAIGNKKLQLKVAEQLGLPADHCCDSSKETIDEWLEDKTNGHRPEVF